MALICIRKIYRNYIGSVAAEKGSWQRDGVSIIHDMCFPGGSAVKNMLANVRDVDLIPWIGGSPGEGNGKPFQVPAWEILWTEEPGGLQSVASQVRQHFATKQQQQHGQGSMKGLP